MVAVPGLYGVMSFTVGQRTREIGVRMALGARERGVAKMVLHRGPGLAAVGMGIGLGITLMLSRLISSQLFAVSPTDPVTCGSIVVKLTGAALIACWLPVRRATRVNPAEVLPSE